MISGDIGQEEAERVREHLPTVGRGQLLKLYDLGTD